jgi:hypothetical protein
VTGAAAIGSSGCSNGLIDHQRGGRTPALLAAPARTTVEPINDRRTPTGRAVDAANRWAPAATLPISGGRERTGPGPGGRKRAALAAPKVGLI